MSKDQRIEELERKVTLLARENAALKHSMGARRSPDKDLLMSEWRYRALFENMTSGFVLFKAVLGPDDEPEDLVVVAANAGFARTTGLELAEATGRRITEVLPGLQDDTADWIGRYCRVATTGIPCRLDTGSELLGRHYTVSAYRPEPGFCAVSFLDVTEHKDVERSLRRSEERFSKSFHVSPVGLTITDADTGAFVEVNQAFLEMFGYARDEVMGRRATEIGMLSPAEATRAIAAQLLTGGVSDYELKATTKSGRRLDLLAYSNAIDLGGHAHYVTHFVDITERNREKRALRDSEARYRALVAQAPDAIVITNRDQTLREANTMACHLFGYAPEDFAGGLTARDLVADSDAALQQSAFKRLLVEERVITERRFKRKNGQEFTGELIACKVDDDQFLAIIRDLTASKEAEADRRLLEDQLHVSQRLEAIGLLAGGVAHDFNNMLSIILTCSDIALESAGGNDELQDDLAQIIAASRRASVLTRQLLAFSRSQIMQPVLLDLNASARGLEKMLRRLIGEDIDYTHKLADEVAPVFADPGQIDQVLLNLIVNARDAMPRGGELTIETANVDVGHDDDAARDVRPGAYVRLSVTDTGTGMDEETAAHIFEPFFTTKPKGKGTGLGLSTVYGIVRQSGGTVRVSSQPERGSTFNVFLPVHAGSLPPQSKSLPARRRSETTGTLLVVEDDDALRRVVVRSLEQRGYEVLQASSGPNALALAAAHPGDIALLITDVVMPRMSGEALAEELTSAMPDLRVLYVSGYANTDIARLGMLGEGAHFLAKPFTGETLHKRVQEALGAAR